MLAPASGPDYYAAFHAPYMRLLYRMHRAGMAVDVPYFDAQAAKAQDDAKPLVAALDEWAGREVNWRSPDQLIALFKDKDLKPSPVWKKGLTRGAWKTDATAVEYMGDHAKDPTDKAALRTLAELRKLYSSLKYLTKIPGFALPDQHGVARVHPNIGPDTETLRLAVAKPELQQIPRDKRKDAYRIRRGFIAPPGKVLVVVDQSQLEMRIQAHLHIKLFGDDRLARDIDAADCHSANAIRVFGSVYPGRFDGIAPTKEALTSSPDPVVANARDDIKAVIYGIGYGKEAHGLGATLRNEHGDPLGKEKAEAILEALYEIYPGMREYKKWVRRYVREKAAMPSLLGVWLDLPDGHSDERFRVDRAARKAMNRPMQAGAAEIMEWVMLTLAADPRMAGSDLVMQVHDELIVEVDEARAPVVLEIVTKTMAAAGEAFGLLVPLKAEGGIARSWEEAK